MLKYDKQNSIDVGRRWIASCRTPKLRTMRQFAEQEIIIPDGPYKGLKYKTFRQPFSRLWFDLVDSTWRLINSLGPVQSGKTLLCWVIPICYHLFEIQESVVAGVPTMDMAKDKWLEDLLPIIEASRYRDLLPIRGAAAKGGSNFTGIKFRHGPTLKFMSDGGGNEKVAGFTTRVVAITEVDKFGAIGKSNPETDKISQLHARTKAYGKRARIYQECTVTTDEGRIWSDYQIGTASRIARPCPHCRDWVTPERDQLTGWAEAPDVETAKESATWRCPSCGNPWTEEQRREANAASVVVHKGQEIRPDGSIVGPAPRTDTLGFRWSAADNHFLEASDIAAEEWTRARAEEPEAGERYMLQFIYATPIESDAKNANKLTAASICERQRSEKEGIVPKDIERITIGVDVHKYLIYWKVMGWTGSAAPHVIAYGRHPVASKDLGEERAIMIALQELRDQFEEGWPQGDAVRTADAVWIDSQWHSDTVKAFCAACKDERYQAIQGFGAGQHRKVYSQPRSTGATVKLIGDGWHIIRQKHPKGTLAEINVDQWKTWFHARLVTPIGQPGALTIYHTDEPNGHLALAAQYLAERYEEVFERGKGLVGKWIQVSKNNHWGDTAVYACAAANRVGIRLLEGSKPASKPAGGWWSQRRRRR